jgi:hypothetical protein
VTDSLSNLEIAVIGADSDGSRGRVVVRLTATELGSFSAVFKLLSTDLSAGVQQAGTPIWSPARILFILVCLSLLPVLPLLFLKNGPHQEVA